MKVSQDTAWRDVALQLRLICANLPEALETKIQGLMKSEKVPEERPEGVWWPLTQGQWMLISPEDVARISGHSWFAVKSGPDFYARAKIEGITTPVHRFILGLERSKAFVDHENNNTLDNRRSNLRPATRSQNMQNRRAHGFKRTTDGEFKGVFARTTKRGCPRFFAVIRTNNIREHLGTFDTAVEAAKEYDAFARVRHGEFANLNFPGITDYEPRTKPSAISGC